MSKTEDTNGKNEDEKINGCFVFVDRFWFECWSVDCNIFFYSEADVWCVLKIELHPVIVST